MENTNNSEKIIIGLTGTLASGKGSICTFLKEKGFAHLSVRDFLIEEIEKRNLLINRDSMVLVANQLREMNGSNYIVEKLYEKAKEINKNCIIESIRNPGEVKALKEKPNFYLIAIDADPKLRYERAFTRKSETDNQTFEEFIIDEKREMESTDPNKQNLSYCISKANYLIENNGSLEELYKKIDEISKKISSGKYIRPSWDEYFMGVAKVIAKRATCDRGRMGCVIARDSQLLVTGYVGSPVGLPHCDDEGHLMKEVLNEDGKISKHCVRTIHGEQNALCQAAKLGVSIKGGTLYTTLTPCVVCAKMLINAGIKRIVCEKRYHRGAESEELFRKSGVHLDITHDEVEKYKNQ
jgi:dCMP deaminase